MTVLSPIWPHALLTHLREQRALELAENTSLTDLATQLGKKVTVEGDLAALAHRISDWLINQEAVVELYVDDEALVHILKHLR